MRKQQQQVPPRRQADTAEPGRAGRGEVLRCLKKPGIRTGSACLRGPVSRGAELKSSLCILDPLAKEKILCLLIEGTRHLPQGIIRERRHGGLQIGRETGSLPGFFLRSHKKEKAGHLTVTCLYWLMGGV